MSFSENRATLMGENYVRLRRKFGHFFSTTVQVSPALNTLFVIRSKYPASFFGFVIFQAGDMSCPNTFPYLCGYSNQ